MLPSSASTPGTAGEGSTENHRKAPHTMLQSFLATPGTEVEGNTPDTSGLGSTPGTQTIATANNAMDQPRNVGHADIENGDGHDTNQALPADPSLPTKIEHVEDELQHQGMGRYMWAMFFQCGGGFFLDLMFPHGFGLAVPIMQKEFGFADAQLGNLAACFAAGEMVGALVWGVIADLFGRYYVFSFTLLVAGVFSMCLAAPRSYAGVLALAALVGFGIGGNIPTNTMILLECLPRGRWRRHLLASVSIFRPLGLVIMSLLAYALLPDNKGWRNLMLTLGGIGLFLFLVRFFFPFQESPQYLVYREQDARAIESLEHIARFNQKDCRLTLQALRRNPDAANSDDGQTAGASQRGFRERTATAYQETKRHVGKQWTRSKELFGTPDMRRRVILVWIIYVFAFWAVTNVNAFLPTILERKGATKGLSRERKYLFYVYTYLPGILGVVAAAGLYKWPRVALASTSLLFAASLVTLTVVDTVPAYIGIGAMVRFFQLAFFAVLYSVTAELYPVPVRGTACGAASLCGRLSSIVAPLAGARVLAASLNGVFYMSGASMLVCTGLSSMLPRWVESEESEESEKVIEGGNMLICTSWLARS